MGEKTGMSKKRNALVVAAAAAGMIGMWAPAAFAGTGGGGDAGGLLNASHNQVSGQGCSNFVPVNGVGGQVPVTGVSGALGLLTGPGVISSKEDKSCHQAAAQANASDEHAVWHVTRKVTQDPAHAGAARTVDLVDGPAGGDVGGLVNISHNQVPIQVCNNHVPVNAVGGQVPVSDISGALSLLSAPGITASWQDSSCHQKSAQDNG